MYHKMEQKGCHITNIFLKHVNKWHNLPTSTKNQKYIDNMLEFSLWRVCVCFCARIGRLYNDKLFISELKVRSMALRIRFRNTMGSTNGGGNRCKARKC